MRITLAYLIQILIHVYRMAVVELKRCRLGQCRHQDGLGGSGPLREDGGQGPLQPGGDDQWRQHLTTSTAGES